MAKFCGNIGYVETIETEPGIWEEKVVERLYYGDILNGNFRYQPSNNVNDNINISNRISIVADSYATENTQRMKYVNYMGSKWKISDIDTNSYPRLILTVGGVYNGEQA